MTKTELKYEVEKMGKGWFILKLANDYAGGTYDTAYGKTGTEATRMAHYNAIKGQRREAIEDLVADILAGTVKGNKIRVDNPAAPMKALQVMALLATIYNKVAD